MSLKKHNTSSPAIKTVEGLLFLPKIEYDHDYFVNLYGDEIGYDVLNSQDYRGMYVLAYSHAKSIVSIRSIC